MTFFLKATLLSLAALAAVPARAQTPASDSLSTVEAGPFSSTRAVTQKTLETATAREDISIVAQTQQTSTVSRSSVSGNVRTGDVGVAGNAFQNATGLTVVNSNSGNNVAMNGSINVNIVMSPPAPQ